MTRLRLISLNLWKNDGDYPARLHRILADLRPWAADLIAVQEAFAAPSLGLDSAAFLADGLGLQVTSLPLRQKPRQVDGQWVESSSGQALLSRWPVQASRCLALPSDPADGERAALLVDLLCAGHRVTVAVLHLTHLAGAQDLRRQQWRAIADGLAVAPLAVAAGDFNTPLAALAPEQQGFRDCRASCGQPARSTLISGGDPGGIDHVLVRGAVQVLGWQIILDHPTPVASDHCGVLVDLAIGA